MSGAIGWSPSRPRKVTGLVIGLLTGGAGWPVIACFYLFILPVDLLPVVPNALGEWTLSFWVGLSTLVIGWTAAAGVSLKGRILREPREVPFSRQGIRGWSSLFFCCTALGVGAYASMLVVAWAGLEAFGRAPAGVLDFVLVRGVLLAGLIGPTLGLLLARAACLRWLRGSGPTDSSSQTAQGMQPAAVTSPPRDPESPILPASA